MVHRELVALEAIVEVLTSRYSEQGTIVNPQDPYLPNLVQELWHLLQSGAYQDAYFYDLVEHCHMDATAAQKPAALVVTAARRDMAAIDRARYFVVAALSGNIGREPLWTIVESCAATTDILEGYYDEDALLRDASFLNDLVVLLKRLERGVKFGVLDLSAMACYSERCAPLPEAQPVETTNTSTENGVVNTNEQKTEDNEEVKEGDEMSAAPGPTRTTTRTRIIRRVSVKPATSPSTDISLTPTSGSLHQLPRRRIVNMYQQTDEWRHPDEDAYRRIDAELAQRTADLMRREMMLDAREETLREQIQDHESQKASLRTTLRALKDLYNDLFNKARSGDDLTDVQIDSKLPIVMRALGVERINDDDSSENNANSIETTLILSETVELPATEQLRVQGGVCSCGTQLRAPDRLDGLLHRGPNKARLCEYTGRLYCGLCHTRKSSMLPAKVLQRWDFKQYRVCDKAHAYLTQLYNQPVFDVQTLQPSLLIKVPRLQACQALRSQIVILGDVVARCRDARSEGLLRTDSHIYHESTHYSIGELFKASKGSLVDELKAVRDECVRHTVQTCSLCRSRVVRRCAACSSDEQLFVFDTKKVMRCPNCQEAFHAACYDVVGCRTCSSR